MIRAEYRRRILKCKGECEAVMSGEAVMSDEKRQLFSDEWKNSNEWWGALFLGLGSFFSLK